MAKKKKGQGKKSGMPSWVKPTIAMIVGGGLGLVAMGILPDAIGPYAPAAGVLLARFVGGGGWSKYLVTAGVVGGVTFLSRRKTVQVAAGSLKAAKDALAAGGGGSNPPAVGSGSAADRGADILRKQGLSSVK